MKRQLLSNANEPNGKTGVMSRRGEANLARFDLDSIV